MTRHRESFHDLDAMTRLFGRWNGSFLQLSRGKFAAEAGVAQGRKLRCFQVQANQHVRTLGGADGTTCTLIPVTGPLGECCWQQRRVAAGEVILRGCDIPYDASIEPAAKVTALLVSEHRLREAHQSLMGREIARRLSGWHSLHVAPVRVPRLLTRAGEFLAASASTTVGAAVCEDACLRELVACIADGPAEIRPLASRAALVKTALEFLHSTLNRPVSSLEICQAVRANDRTLRLAFQERFDVGPVAYQRILRMHAVRKALKNGEMQSVREAALIFGFTRLGSFAAEYRIHFGERPSETLGSRPSGG